MSASTFGDWEACGNLVREKRTADNPAGFLVAEVPVIRANAAAEAHLIAAAPALLKSLQWALSAMEARNPVWAEGDNFAAASAAINQATGSTS